MVKVVSYAQFGDTSVLEFTADKPKPKRKPGEVLVHNVSTSISPVDFKVRKGGPLSNADVLPKIPGGDVSGIVEESEPDSRFQAGDKVYALTNGFLPWDTSEGGSYAEYVSVPGDQLARAPGKSISLEQAGGVPLVALTALQTLDRANVGAGQRVLVLSASGGVGHFVVQLAKLRGAYVVGTTGSSNIEFVKDLGADEVVDYRSEEVSDEYKEQGFDVVVDMIGGTTGQKAYKLLPKSGVYAFILTGNPGDVEQVASFEEAYKQGTGPRAERTMVVPDGPGLQYIAKLLDSGSIRLAVDRSFPLERVREATEYAELGHVRGKVVLTI